MTLGIIQFQIIQISFLVTQYRLLYQRLLYYASIKLVPSTVKSIHCNTQVLLLYIVIACRKLHLSNVVMKSLDISKIQSWILIIINYLCHTRAYRTIEVILKRNLYILLYIGPKMLIEIWVISFITTVCNTYVLHIRNQTTRQI